MAIKSARHLKALSRTVQKRATPGEQIFGKLFPNRVVGMGSGWTGDRLQYVQHMTDWTFVAVNAIWTRTASIMPNLATVSDVAKPGLTVKACERGSMRGFTSQWRDDVESKSRQGLAQSYAGSFGHESGSSFMTIGEYRSKALSVVKPHEELEPLPSDHPLRRLIDDPNPLDTSFDLFYEWGMFLELCGIAYLWAIPNAFGRPSELWVLPSHWVWPRTGGGQIVDEEHPNADKLIEWYEVRPWSTGGFSASGMLRIPANEVICARFKSPMAKLDGYSKLWAVSKWIDTEESISKSRWAQFINQARPEFWVELGPGYTDPDDDMIARMEARIAQKHQGEYNLHRPIFTPSGTKVTALSFNPTEMAYFQSEEQIRDMILSAFGVPKAAVGVTSDMTYGSVLATLMSFCEQAINPRLAMLGQTLTKQLASRWDKPGERVKLWWDNMTPADPAQVNADIQADGGAITWNEIRAIRGRKPYKRGGDNPMVQGPGGLMPMPVNVEEDMEDLGALVAQFTNQADAKPDAGQQQEPEGEVNAPTAQLPEAARWAEDVQQELNKPGVNEPNGAPSKWWKRKSKFEEDEHPRADDGKFSSGPGGGGRAPDKKKKPSVFGDEEAMGPPRSKKREKWSKLAAQEYVETDNEIAMMKPGKEKKAAMEKLEEMEKFLRRNGLDVGQNLSTARAESPNTIFFHGTSAVVLDAIMSEGLVPGKSKGADAWAEKHDLPLYTKLMGENRQASTYIANDRSVAEKYAKRVKELTGNKTVILQIQVPKDKLKDFKPDEKHVGAMRYEGTIPPEWIKVVKSTVKNTFYLGVLTDEYDDDDADESNGALSKSINKQFHQWCKRWTSKKYGGHDYSSTQFNLEGSALAMVEEIQALIDDDDLTDKGKEDVPHVTIRYGLEDSDAGPVRQLVEAFGPVSVNVGQVDYFPAENHDVLILRVESAKLRRLNALLGKLPNVQTHVEYQPHITLAYVKPGMGELYVELLERASPDEQGVWIEEPLEFRELVFSPKEGTPTMLELASYAYVERKKDLGWSYHGVDCDKATFDRWKASMDRGVCPWCGKRVAAAHNNRGKHLQACPSRPTAPVSSSKSIRKESGGTCKPGERADVTGCVPADRGGDKKQEPAAQGSAKGQAAVKQLEDEVESNPKAKERADGVMRKVVARLKGLAVDKMTAVALKGVDAWLFEQVINVQAGQGSTLMVKAAAFGASKAWLGMRNLVMSKAVGSDDVEQVLEVMRVLAEEGGFEEPTEETAQRLFDDGV